MEYLDLKNELQDLKVKYGIQKNEEEKIIKILKEKHNINYEDDNIDSKLKEINKQNEKDESKLLKLKEKINNIISDVKNEINKLEE